MFRTHREKTILLFVCMVLIFSSQATPAVLALHSLHLDVWVEEGATINGEAYYHDAKAVGAKVEVFAPDGTKLGATETGEKGEFAFTAEYKCDHKFVVTDGGHRASAVIPAEDLPDDLPAFPGGSN